MSAFFAVLHFSPFCTIRIYALKRINIRTSDIDFFLFAGIGLPAPRRAHVRLKYHIGI